MCTIDTCLLVLHKTNDLFDDIHPYPDLLQITSCPDQFFQKDRQRTHPCPQELLQNVCPAAAVVSTAAGDTGTATPGVQLAHKVQGLFAVDRQQIGCANTLRRPSSFHATGAVSNGTIADPQSTTPHIWATLGKAPSLAGYYSRAPSVNHHFVSNYVTQDVLRRIMSDYFGYDLHFVMNVTDIDDKVRRFASSFCGPFLDKASFISRSSKGHDRIIS